MTLRPYQQEQVAAVLRQFDGAEDSPAVRSTLVVAPTASGKTVTFAALIRAFEERGARSLVLAHREELLTQARDKIRQWAGCRVDLERAQDYADAPQGSFADQETGPATAVVASVQTLSQPKRLARWRPDTFGLVIVDEAHHATATTYRRILDHFSPACRLGVTATPDRGDEAALGKVFESVAHVYEVRQAIADGYISDLRLARVEVEGLDLSKLRTVAGDFAEGELDSIMREERHLHAVADPVVQLAGDRPTLVFGVTVEHARLLVDQINRRKPNSARWLSGASMRDERADTLRDFAAGRFQFLGNCSLFTEGTDIPRIACVAVARPTKSRALMAQMVGRGFRLSPETGKTDCLVLDFAGNVGRHDVATPLRILDGDMTPAVEVEAAEIQREGRDLTAAEILAEAEKRVHEETLRLLAAQRRAQVVATAKMRVIEVNPFGLLNAETERGRWGGKPITDAQRRLIKKLGLPAWKPAWGEFPDRYQASKLINTLRKRRMQGLASPKQARVLAEHGLSPDVTRARASALIERAARVGWRGMEQAAVVNEAMREVGEDG